ncbi:MAG: zinc ribbon domain-containing protein [Chloroflexi bacterium]|nr:zinc ribbon domain-containing protein [Chloroflexota bacterium]
MICTHCGASTAVGDNFCRYCGTPLRIVRLPANLSQRVPMVWQPTTVWRGLAAVAVGTALELLRRELVRRLESDGQPAMPRGLGAVLTPRPSPRGRGVGGEGGPQPPASDTRHPTLHGVVEEVLLVRRLRHL